MYKLRRIKTVRIGMFYWLVGAVVLMCFVAFLLSS
jgi:hypothetical protein